MTAAAVIGLIFSPLAGAMAFVITYEEYSHHHLQRRVVLGRSLEAALVTTVFFCVLSLALGGLLPHLLVGAS
jgi:hypothetical protein